MYFGFQLEIDVTLINDMETILDRFLYFAQQMQLVKVNSYYDPVMKVYAPS